MFVCQKFEPFFLSNEFYHQPQLTKAKEKTKVEKIDSGESQCIREGERNIGDIANMLTYSHGFCRGGTMFCMPIQGIMDPNWCEQISDLEV